VPLITLSKGSAFFTPEVPRIGVKRHLYFILSSVTVSAERVVVANVSSSATNGEPEPCVLSKGEHPSIGHDSYLRCEEARVATAADIQRLVASGALSPTADLSAGIIERFQDALGRSKFTRREVKAVLRDQGLIER
jgi:hypothetical protein